MFFIKNSSEAVFLKQLDHSLGVFRCLGVNMIVKKKDAPACPGAHGFDSIFNPLMQFIIGIVVVSSVRLTIE